MLSKYKCNPTFHTFWHPPPPPSQDCVSVSALPSPPVSPKIYCSQLRQAQHDEQSEKEMIAITVDEKVSDWRQRNKLDLNTALLWLMMMGRFMSARTTAT